MPRSLPHGVPRWARAVTRPRRSNGCLTVISFPSLEPVKWSIWLPPISLASSTASRSHRRWPTESVPFLAKCCRLPWCGVRSDAANPARAVQRHPERSRARYLSGEDVKRLGDALFAAQRSKSEPWQAIAAIRMLLFSGCRRGEVLGMRWEYIDYDNGVVLLPTSKTGRKTVHLSAPILQILSELPRKDGNPWVLPSRLAVNDRPFEGVGHVWLRIRATAGLNDVRLHDLRHTFASKGDQFGHWPPSACLGMSCRRQRQSMLTWRPIRRAMPVRELPAESPRSCLVITQRGAPSPWLAHETWSKRAKMLVETRCAERHKD